MSIAFIVIGLYIVGGVVSVYMTKYINRLVKQGKVGKGWETEYKHIWTHIVLSWIVVAICIAIIIKYSTTIKFINGYLKNWFEGK